MFKSKIRTEMLKVLCLLLIAGMTSSFSSCGKSEVDSKETGSETMTDIQTETALLPSIQEADMNGKSIHIFQQDWWGYMPLAITDITVEELNGEGINDAAYNRNLEMMQRFNCTIDTTVEIEPTPGYNKIIQSVIAGDDTYTFVILRAGKYSTMCLSESFYELSEIPNIDFSKPWWDDGFAESVGILGKKFGAISDITMNSYLLAGSVYFNKDMIIDHSLDDPFTLVHDGTWTWDTLFSMADVVDMDLNGDGEYTNQDLYGITYIDDSPEVLLAAAGVTFAELDNDRIPQITLYGEEYVTKIMRLSDLLQDTTISYNCHVRSEDAGADEANMLVRGNTLFCLGGLYYAPEMRLMDQDFGIIPYPKYDENQSEYRVPMITQALTYVSVPISNSDVENTGIFMEYYAYLGRRDVMPALYEKLLLGKVSRDSESSAMLDIIFNNRFYDIGMIFDFAGLRTDLRQKYHNMEKDFMSSLVANKVKVQNNIDELVEHLQSLEK